MLDPNQNLRAQAVILVVEAYRNDAFDKNVRLGAQMAALQHSLREARRVRGLI